MILLKLLTSISPMTWIRLALVAIIVGALATLHFKLEHDALERQAANYEARMRAQRDLYEQQMQLAHDTAQKQLDKVNADWGAAFDRHMKEDTAAAAQRAKDLAKLKE